MFQAKKVSPGVGSQRGLIGRKSSAGGETPCNNMRSSSSEARQIVLSCKLALEKGD